MPDASNPPTSVNIQVANASQADCQFARNVVALLCDPAYQTHADSFRSGHASIDYGPGGAMSVMKSADPKTISK